MTTVAFIVNCGSGTGTYVTGQTVACHGDYAPGGDYFTGWTVVSGDPFIVSPSDLITDVIIGADVDQEILQIMLRLVLHQ